MSTNRFLYLTVVLALLVVIVTMGMFAGAVPFNSRKKSAADE
jgi:hypothetical protein